MEERQPGTVTCARCDEPIQAGERFAHYRWSASGGLLEIAFHDRCHSEMSDEEFSEVIDGTVDALLTAEPELFESEIELYDEGELPPDVGGALRDRG